MVGGSLRVASSTTKAVRHDIAKILLNVMLKHQTSNIYLCTFIIEKDIICLSVNGILSHAVQTVLHRRIFINSNLLDLLLYMYVL